ncbi:MAG: Cof-type HAD-IIB family hydrolase [Lachnospiraceae bacterium]|nr:Cof-type HAD-IIB family hydrolase [Lachnospiraceae bacterium]
MTLQESKGILLFDYDGTLVDGSIGIHDMSERTLKALNDARDNGYIVMLASGRSIAMVLPVKDNFNGFITSNGSHAEILGESYHDMYIPVDVLKDIRTFMSGKEDRITGNFETQEGAKALAYGTPLYKHNIAYFNLDESQYSPFEGDYSTGFHKMTIAYTDPAAIKEMIETFAGRIEIIDHPLENYAEVMPFGCTKGMALEAILEKTGYDRDKVYAFGDSENDVTMLKAAGHATIMAKHSPGMEEIAEFVTKLVEEEGIEYALKHYGIIE